MSEKRVLIVEDNLQYHAYVKDVLKGAGYETYSAFNGSEATTILESQTVEVLLTDLLMPEKDGIRLLIESKNLFPGMPVVAMSGDQSNYSEGFLKSATSLGASYTLEKPFPSEQLLSIIQKCFNYI